MTYTITRTKPNEGKWVFKTAGVLPENGVVTQVLKGLINRDNEEIDTEKFKNKTLIICTVPSLPTPTCSKCFAEFNEQAKTLGDDTEILIISNDKVEDLQKGFQQFAEQKMEISSKIHAFSANNKKCNFARDYGIQLSGEASVENVDKNSPDYQKFLDKANSLIAAGWLARTAFVINPRRYMVHQEIVNELTQQPNYQACIEAAKKANQIKRYIDNTYNPTPNQLAMQWGKWSTSPSFQRPNEIPYLNSTYPNYADLKPNMTQEEIDNIKNLDRESANALNRLAFPSI